MSYQKRQTPKREKLNNYAKYSGIAIQMLVIILAGVYGGKKMDEWLNTKKPVFTAIFSLLAVVISIYMVIKDISKK